MEKLPSFLVLSLALIVAASIIEALVLHLRNPGTYDWRSFGVSLLDFIVRNVQRFALPGVVASPLGAWVWGHRLWTVPLDGVAAFALLFVGQEFCYYWYHRAAHRVRLMWATHSVHHSPNQLNLSSAYRLGWTVFFSGAITFFLPLMLLGFQPKVVLATLALNLLYQFWIHATWIPKLGPLEWVLNTPSAHRVHHAANLEYLDGNYGGVTVIFDRLFGTYIEERADLPCRYGWVQPITSNNPFKIELHQWMALGRDLLAARSAREVLGTVFMPPGWKAQGPGQTTQDLRRAAKPVAPI